MKSKKYFKIFMVIGLFLCGLFWLTDTARANDENGFTTPAAGAEVSGIVQLRGTADAADLAKWQVDLLLFGDATRATYLEQARGRRRSGNLGTLDTTNYPDGVHTLRLRVVHRDYNYTEYFSPLTINNADAAPIVNGIIRPSDGITVSRTIQIRGIARHPQFRKWQLDLLSLETLGQDRAIATNTRPMELEGNFADIDTLTLPNGPHALRLRVVYQGGNYEEYITTIFVNNLAAPTDANNGIINPSEGEMIRGETLIRGIADHPTFRKWQLDLVNPATGDATFLAWSQYPRPARGGLTTVNTARYPDGVYQLRLRVVREGYNYDEYFTTVTIENDVIVEDVVGDEAADTTALSAAQAGDE